MQLSHSSFVKNSAPKIFKIITNHLIEYTYFIKNIYTRKLRKLDKALFGKLPIRYNSQLPVVEQENLLQFFEKFNLYGYISRLIHQCNKLFS